MKQVSDILAQAKNLAEKSKTWADLSNAMFDPLDGLVVKRFPDATERAAFRKSEAYMAMHKLVEQKMEETGVVAGSKPKKSGRFLVRVPKTLHAALEHEATAEGTSLNQLVVAKLSARLGSLLNDRRGSLIQAFGEVRDGFSADRVIADPKLNTKFLRRCRELGLSGTDYDLNWALMGARKRGLMSDLPKTKRYTVTGKDGFEYASELAISYLQRTKNVSLDQIICDPELAQEFDKYSARISPGHTSLEYRWCALGGRKAGRRKPEQLQKDGAIGIDMSDLENLGRVPKLKASALPQTGGLYLFSCADSPVFLSHTENLRHRIEQHMDISKSFGLPKWLWNVGPLDLSLAEMPGIQRTSRLATEITLVRKLHPVLNFLQAA
jgi:hypothetical protein